MRQPTGSLTGFPSSPDKRRITLDAYSSTDRYTKVSEAGSGEKQLPPL